MLLTAVIAGLAVGVVFIVVMAVVTESQVFLRSSYVSYMLGANMRGEVKDFLARYPDAKLFVYLRDGCVPDCTPPPPIVEYYFEEGSKAADVRVLFREGQVVFVQSSCHNLADENDYATTYGPAPEQVGFPNVAEFPHDPHCP
jgi:hypothetical protein